MVPLDIVNQLQGAGSVPDIQQVIPIINELSQKEEVIAIVLFGSFARGQVRSISDIDLCIVTSRDLSQSAMWDLLSYGSRQVEVNLFWDLPVTIRFRVIREGQVLFCRDTLSFHRIKVDTVQEYLDIAPLIRRHCLQAIKAGV